MNLESANSTEIIDLINVHCRGVLRVMKSISKNLIQNNKTTVIRKTRKIKARRKKNNWFWSFAQHHDATISL